MMISKHIKLINASRMCVSVCLFSVSKAGYVYMICTHIHFHEGTANCYEG